MANHKNNNNNDQRLISHILPVIISVVLSAYLLATAPLDLALYMIILIITLSVGTTRFWKLEASLAIAFWCLILSLVFFWNSLYYMRSTYGLPWKSPLLENEIKCYQDRDVYKEFSSSIIEDQRSIVKLISPNLGKSTFLKAMANDPGVIYYDIALESPRADEPFKQFVKQIFPVWILHIFQLPILIQSIIATENLAKVREIFDSKDMKNYFIDNYGHEPIFIFDHINDAWSSDTVARQLNDFILIALMNRNYKVVVSDNEGEFTKFLSQNLSELEAYAFPDIPDFTQKESHNFQKCMRKGYDSDKIIQDTYLYTNGNLQQYLHYNLYASKYPGKLSESDYKNIILKLINKERWSFEQSSINFPLILEGAVKDWDKKGQNILKTLQLIYWIIKNEDPIRMSSVETYVTREAANNIFNIYENIEDGTIWVDFKSNVHKIYAAREMGLTNIEDLKVRSLRDFKGLMFKHYKFHLKEFSESFDNSAYSLV